MGRATDIINKCFIIQDKFEKETGARVNSFGNQVVPLRESRNYVYDDSNSLDSEGKGRIMTKSTDKTNTISLKNAGAFTNETISRRQSAEIAERKYLRANDRSSNVSNTIYTSESVKSVDNVRQNPEGNIIIPGELLDTMKELAAQNKSLINEVEFLKSKRSESRIRKAFKAPKER